jgi:hypothetical protein
LCSFLSLKQNIRAFLVSTQHKYDVFGYYPWFCLYLETPSCLFFKAKHFGDWILSPFVDKIYSVGPKSLELVPISRHLCQNQDGVQKPNTPQATCESYENITFLKTLHIQGLEPENYHDKNHHRRKKKHNICSNVQLSQTFRSYLL